MFAFLEEFPLRPHTQKCVFKTVSASQLCQRVGASEQALVFIMLDLQAVDHMRKFLETPESAILRNQAYV